MPIDPVVLTVSQVRAAIAAAEGPSPVAPLPVSALTGRIFHAVAASALSSTSRASWQRLDAASIASPDAVRRHLYLNALGGLLERYRAALQGSSEEVSYLWQAVGGFARWLTDVLAAARENGQIRYRAEEERWEISGVLGEIERPVSWHLAERTWTGPVRVEGRLDAVIRHPVRLAWCVVEYKLGRSGVFADLAQVCLYREMLARESAGDGSIAVVRFGDAVQETFFGQPELTEVRQRLVGLIGALAGVDAKRDSPWSAPQAPEQQPPKPDHDELGKKLVRAMTELGTPVRLDGPMVAGPAFLRWPLQLGAGVRSKSVIGQADELRVRLRLPGPPAIHIAKSGQIVVDVPRPDRQTVLFGDVAGQIPPADGAGMGTRFPVGVDIDGTLHCGDLAASPHVLAAGTSGSGKSEWLRMALAGLLMSNSPATLRVVCVDPKMNAFGDMKSSPFLWDNSSLIYPPQDSALESLEALAGELQRRKAVFESAGVDDIRQFVTRTGTKMPRLVWLCDEYASLIVNRKERVLLEERIGLIGAMGRSLGIHLIIATQQPSRKVVSGALQTNLSCRVALTTVSSTESRMLIERSGAENLLKQGDLLFWDLGEPVRLQAPLLTEAERKRIYSGGALALRAS